MATDDEKKKDFQTLTNLLTVIDDQLKILVHERQDLFRKESLSIFRALGRKLSATLFKRHGKLKAVISNGSTSRVWA